MRILIYLILIIQLFSCAKKKDQIFDTPQKVIVAGVVHNYHPSLKQVEIYIHRLSQPQNKLIVNLDSMGNFQTTFETYLPTDLHLWYRARIFAIAHPNDSIYVEIDGSANSLADFTKAIKYSGDSKETNQAISIMNLKYDENQSNSYENRMKAIKELDTESYLLHIDSVFQYNTKLYNDFVLEAKPNDEAKLWASMYIEQAYFDALDQYPGAHSYLNNLKDFEVEPAFFEPLTKRLPLKKPMLTNAFSMDSYISNMYNFAFRKTNELIVNPTATLNYDSILTFGIIKQISDPLLRQLVLFREFYGEIDQNKIDFYVQFKDLADLYIKEPFLKNPLNEYYNKKKKELEAPKILSDSIYSYLKNTTVGPIFDSILSISKGKVIYIDCWAVWCGPCIARFPDSKKLHEELNGQAIEFVYLCLESDSAKWQNLVEKHELEGQNYLLNDLQSKELRKAFEILSIPHYILIDKKGVLFEKSAANPRVETEKIKKLIHE